MPRFLAAFLLAIGLLISAPAGAFTAYYTAAEDLDLSGTGNVSIDTTSTHFRSSWTRSAFRATSSNTPSGANNLSTWNVVNKFSASSLWFTTRVWHNSAATICGNPNCGSNPPFDWIRFTDINNITRLSLRITTGSSGTSGISIPGTVGMYKASAAGTYTKIGASLTCGIAVAPGVPDKLDFQIQNYGVSGTLNLYINNTLCYTYTGDVTTDGNTTINGFMLGSPGNFDNTTYVSYSEIIVADSDTRSLGLATLIPSGTGNSNSWTCTGASPAASVNTVVNTDASNCNTGANNQLQQFSVSTLPGGSWSVVAVGVSIRSAGGTSGPTGIQPVVRTGGADYTSATQTQVLSLQNYQGFWYANPNTSGPWTTSDVNAAGFNIGVKSIP